MSKILSKRIAKTIRPPDLPAPIATQILQTFQRLTSLEQRRYHSNITKDELQALKTIRHNENIVIKLADKGSGIMVMNKQQYIQENCLHLQDEDIHERAVYDYTTQLAAKINLHLKNMANYKEISWDIYKTVRMNTDDARIQ